MKILEVVFTLASGGAERFVVDISNELSKNNEVVLMTLKDDKVDSDHRLFYKFDLNDKVKYVNLGLGDGFSFRTLWAIYKRIKSLNPDVVHLNVGNCPKFCILAITLLCRKIKFYQTIHNDMTGYDDTFYRLFFKSFGRFKKVRFAALSDTNYKDLMRMHPYVDARCIVNGRAPILPTRRFDSVKDELNAFRTSPNTKIVLHVARFSRQKNQQLLIDAFKELATRNVDAQLVILGSGFDTKEGQMLLSNAADNVHYLGTRKNIGDYHLGADIFTLSSSYEGMPITLLEASLAGVPCVSTPVCGSVDLIVDGENGKLSKDFTKESYVEALLFAIEHHDMLKANAMLMREDSPYTIKMCAEKYSSFFNC